MTVVVVWWCDCSGGVVVWRRDCSGGVVVWWRSGGVVVL